MMNLMGTKRPMKRSILQHIFLFAKSSSYARVGQDTEKTTPTLEMNLPFVRSRKLQKRIISSQNPSSFFVSSEKTSSYVSTCNIQLRVPLCTVRQSKTRCGADECVADYTMGKLNN